MVNCSIKMRYNIVFSSSNIYIPFCMAAIDSLLSNNEDVIGGVTINVIDNGIDIANLSKLKKLCDGFKAGLRIIKTDDLKKKLESSCLSFNFNISSALRVFIADWFPNEDKVLFIDSDTYMV